MVKACRKKHLKFNMLPDYCIGKAALVQKEFLYLPVGDKFYCYDSIAVNAMVKNHTGEVRSCDIDFKGDYQQYREDYLNISFLFHHTQMDGAHIGNFLANRQTHINGFK